MWSHRLDSCASTIARAPATLLFLPLFLAGGSYSFGELLIDSTPTWLAVCLLGDLVCFGWVWCVGIAAYRASAGEASFLTPNVATGGLLLGLLARSALEASPTLRGPGIVPLLLVLGGPLAYGLVIAFAARSLHRALGAEWGPVEYLGVGMLLFLAPLGVWVIQRWARRLGPHPPARASRAAPV